MFYVYEIVCKPTKQRYIGKTVDLGRRFSQHRRELNRGAHCNCLLQAAWDKFGQAEFDFRFLEEKDDERSAVALEESLIEEAHAAELGFNISPYSKGTSLVWHPNRAAALVLLSDAGKKRIGDMNPFHGRKHTEETKAKIRQSKTDHPQPLPSNTRKVMAGGVEYESGAAAARALKVCNATIVFRIKSKHWPDFYYVQD